MKTKRVQGFGSFAMWKTNLAVNTNNFGRRVRCCHNSKLEYRNLLVLGLGYLGKALALQLARQGWKVTGTKRTQSLDKELLESGVEVITLDTESSNHISDIFLQKLSLATHLLICIPANHRGDPLLSKWTQQVSFPNLQELRIRWIGYISSTVVYEPNDSEIWIDEDAPLATYMKKASYYISAEEQWKRWIKDSKAHLVIFRLSALYGPSRSALDTLIRMQLLHMNVSEFLQSSSFAGDVLISRIHLTDACEKIATSMILEPMLPNCPCTIVNLSDNLPSTRADCFYYARQLLDEDTVEAWKAAHVSREKISSFLVGESFGDVHKLIRTRISASKKGKRILNQRMKTLFGESLHFPTYFQGLVHVKNAILTRYLSIFKEE